MITTYLQGGLGNQMFQIAATYAHAKKHGDEAVFDLNNSHTPHQGENSSKYRGRLFKFKHTDNVYDVCNKPFSQPGHSYCEIPYEPNQQLQGFYQSEKFFLNIKDEIVELFREGLAGGYYFNWTKINSDLHKLKQELNKPIVAIHIRRGDYLKFLGVHDPCPISYYNQAMELMKEKVGDFHAYFVSDDIEWCREIFGGHGSFSKYTDEIDDMILMVNCDHNIIANSSFSWWSAYLNENPDKVVIGPERWFGPRGPQDQQDIIPNNWIKV
jgi:hypothetical protein